MAVVLNFSEDFDTMTHRQCIAFIARGRRQLTRLKNLPESETANVDWREVESTREFIDALERRIRSDPNCPADLAFP